VLIAQHRSRSGLCSGRGRGLMPLQGALARAMSEALCCSASHPEHRTSKRTRARQLTWPCSLHTNHLHLLIRHRHGLVVLHVLWFRPHEIAGCRLLKVEAPGCLGNTSHQRMCLCTYFTELHEKIQVFCVSQTNLASDSLLKFMFKNPCGDQRLY